MSGIQGVTCQFSKNQNPGQSCHPTIDLTMVLNRNQTRISKKLLPTEVIQTIIHNYRRILGNFFHQIEPENQGL